MFVCLLTCLPIQDFNPSKQHQHQQNVNVEAKQIIQSLMIVLLWQSMASHRTMLLIWTNFLSNENQFFAFFWFLTTTTDCCLLLLLLFILLSWILIFFIIYYCFLVAKASFFSVSFVVAIEAIKAIKEIKLDLRGFSVALKNKRANIKDEISHGTNFNHFCCFDCVRFNSSSKWFNFQVYCCCLIYIIL